VTQIYTPQSTALALQEALRGVLRLPAALDNARHGRMARTHELLILRTRQPRRGAVLQRVRDAPGGAAGILEPRAYTPRHLVEKILASRAR
jgi:hypothetical protein